MVQKYDKPTPNFTSALLVLTGIATAAAMVFGLPAGWVTFAGVLATAWCHPAPVLTGSKGTPDNAREEVLVFQHRIWLDIRNSPTRLTGSARERVPVPHVENARDTRT